MAQGLLKSNKKGATVSGGAAKKKNSTTKRLGNLVVASKKTSIAKRREMIRKHTGALTAMAEQQLGARAGHLELIGPGKKARNAAAAGGPKGKGKGPGAK